ncbi:hypothetical protein [Rhodococcus marinonascens]|uniref:hypothetical protein n=1 Tax=Rhodococcus marinonascens TaxID=38311 RepID=UPI0009334C35|nr:hypothetical protein [Rhodococcus marinonascens]
MDNSEIQDSSDAKTAPAALPADWSPDDSHRKYAERLGISGMFDALADQFAKDARTSGKRRSKWAQAFTRYLHQFEEADGRTFPWVDTDEARNAAVDAALEAVKTEAPAPEAEQVEEVQVEDDAQDPWEAMFPGIAPAPEEIQVDAPEEVQVEDDARRWTYQTETVSTPVVDHVAEAEQVRAMFAADATESDKKRQEQAKRARVSFALNAIDSRLLTRKMRSPERERAEELLYAGRNQDDVHAEIISARKNARAEIEAKLHAVA